MGVEALAVARDDARRLLAAMLERVQAEVGDVRGLGVAVHRDDAALVVEAVVVVLEELVAAGVRQAACGDRRSRARAVEHGEMTAHRLTGT